MKITTLDELVALLGSLVPRPGPEALLAIDVTEKLKAAGIPLQQEAVLTCGRVDLVVGAIAIELKTKGTATAVQAQLERYAKDPKIEAMILFTTSAKLRSMPRTIEGKPLRVVYSPRL